MIYSFFLNYVWENQIVLLVCLFIINSYRQVVSVVSTHFRAYPLFGSPDYHANRRFCLLRFRIRTFSEMVFLQRFADPSWIASFLRLVRLCALIATSPNCIMRCDIFFREPWNSISLDGTLWIIDKFGSVYTYSLIVGEILSNLRPS